VFGRVAVTTSSLFSRIECYFWLIILISYIWHFKVQSQHVHQTFSAHGLNKYFFDVAYAHMCKVASKPEIYNKKIVLLKINVQFTQLHLFEEKNILNYRILWIGAVSTTKAI